MSKLPLYTIEPSGSDSSGISGSRVNLNNPISMPKAAGFLWNKHMMIQMNCQGYAVSQFLQPEPAKYSFAPNMEAKTFMQPEHYYYRDHPGRFFYVKDEDSGEIFSAPYEPVRSSLDKFSFSVGHHDIKWNIEALDLCIDITLTLGVETPVELWSINITNMRSTQTKRNISVYPYFTIGYMSWLNQSATFNTALNAIVAKAVTPYQKVEDYYKNQHFKDQTFLLSDTVPSSWSANQRKFEGQGGLQNPDEINQLYLSCHSAYYEVPTAVLQFQLSLEDKDTKTIKLCFGAAKDEHEIADIKQQYFTNKMGFDKEVAKYGRYLNQAEPCLTIQSGDESFDDFVNHWLPRQMFYHGDINRLTTDPQTRNYLQDNMGMSYLKPDIARQSFLTAIGQQLRSGAMPDGILIHTDATLKYINQIPHTDHCVWLPICLVVYLNETDDASILNERIAFSDSDEKITLHQHVELALDWLLSQTDERGLSLINQGDWCDPMNMVGHKGKGVSAWLSLATAYALKCWNDICQHYLPASNKSRIEDYRLATKMLNKAINKHLWHGGWFARGITDDGKLFGINSDNEGRIYLNPQSWALLSGAANKDQKSSMITEIEKQLFTPFGVMMLAPSYTKMNEDIGRITQKYPGVSENGSVYNHAAVFYAYALFQQGEAQKAFDVLYRMIPNIDKAEQQGQLPVFIPNYYRGAYHQHPEQAGKSSQLFNTGTIAWFYRCLVEELCGLKGSNGELTVSPQLPECFDSLTGTRRIQGAVFNFSIKKSSVKRVKLILDGKPLSGNIILNIQPKHTYQLMIEVPK
jgi:cellobionic acid phosphorylase